MISDKFFEDEVREGFYVPFSIKQAWGAQLTVLEELDRICTKYNINYYAEWGTFLGAVRHGTIIPWDDDFDVGMKRDDYERFLSVWKKEMPNDYDVITFRGHPEHTKFLANVVNCSTICYKPEHLKKYHGFPFIAGIDVFVTDYICRNSEKEKERVNLATYIIVIADKIFDNELSGIKKKEAIDYIERTCHTSINRALNGEQLRANMYAAAERLFARFSEAESDELAQMMPYGLGFGANKLTYPVGSYSEFVRIPFEETTIPVPREYISMLKRRYGNYMKLVKDSGVHGYPYFEAQKEDVVKIINRAYPQYHFDISSLDIARLTKDGTYKTTVLECIEELKKMHTVLETAVYQNDKSVVQNTLADSQQLAIDLGEYIEGIKGEEYDIIHILEDYCESLFAVYDYVINGNACECSSSMNDNCVVHDEYGGKHGKYVAHIICRIKDVVYKMEEVVKTRSEVIFLPFKPDYWNTMEPFYNALLNNADIDVYVVPIPYYYKEYDGTLRDEQYDFDKYPAELNCIRYDSFNYEIHHPDVIYIQNPYDEWNDVTSVNPFFYSKNIIKYTDKLIYVPWFRVADFDKSCEREYMNMRYYCTMPGVAIADEVIVNSSVQRLNYIDKLTEFAGDDTRKIWENKIAIYKDGNEAAKESEAGKESRLAANNKAGEIKRFVYCPDYSSFITYGRLAISKIERTLAKIMSSKNEFTVILAEQSYLRDELKKYDEGMLNEYKTVLAQYKDNPRFCLACYGENSKGITLGYQPFDEPARKSTACFKENAEDINKETLSFDEFAEKCQAYYGDETKLAHFFRNNGKPVMIQNCMI